MKRRRFVVCALLLGLLLSGAAVAGSKKKPTPSQAPTIGSVAPNSITITEGKSVRTLTITQFTEITVNGLKATAAELKPGMSVNVTLGTDATKASRINATGK